MGIDVSPSRRARIIRSYSFHGSIILTLGRIPFLGSEGLELLGFTASRSLISKPGSVTSKRIRFVSEVSALASSVWHLFFTPLMRARSVGFCPNGFKNPPLNLYPLPRLIFVVVLSALLIRRPFLVSSCLYFLHCGRFFLFNFESLLCASHECLRFPLFSHSILLYSSCFDHFSNSRRWWI
jgi:hypothetical protein